MFNITVSAPAATGNVTQVIIRDQALPPFSKNLTSNQTGVAAGTVGFTPAGNNFAWFNLTAPGLVANGTNQSFTIYMNNTMAGAPSSYTLLVCTYNSTNTTAAAFADRACNANDPFFVQSATITLGMNFGFTGYVKLGTNGSYQPNTNITVYDFVAGQGGPPTETPLLSTTTDSDGFFRLWGINGSKSTYKLKLFWANSSNPARVHFVGSNLPPFPSMMFYNAPTPPGMEGMSMMKKLPVINGTTFYLQQAATVNISARGNTTPNAIPVRFGYEVIDQAVGFPMEANIMSSNWNKEVYLTTGRSYTVMATRDPVTFLPYNWCWASGFGGMNDSACPAPPTSKQVTSANLTQGGYVNLVMNLSYTLTSLSGCLDLLGNSTLVNVTRVFTKLVPWEGFVPPIKAEFQEFNVTNGTGNEDLVYNDQARCPGKWAFFNFSEILGSADGVSYLIEFYAKNASNDAMNGTVALAAFQNITMNEASKRINLTLRPLVGQYVTSSTANTTKMKIMVQNTSGAAVTTSMHMEIKVKHPVFGTMHYIVEDLSGGITYLPILNNSNWAKVSVFPNEGPPVEKTLNLALAQNNVTVQVSDFTFRKPLANGSLDSQGINVSNKNIDPFAGINMTFYRNAEGCNTPNPPESCVLTRMDAQNFNPMVVMMAGKVNLELKMTGSGTTLYFVNFDLLSAKPPTNSIMSNNASSASASAQTQTWEAGSFVPHVYDHAFVVMPYNATAGSPDYINESYSGFNISLPYLKDENWNIVWNRSTNTTDQLPDDYTDFNTGSYAPLLTSAGVACNLTNTTDVCQWDKGNNTFVLKVPHFSGLGSGIAGVTAAAAASTTTTTSSSGASAGGAAETEVSESRTFTTIAANSENTFRVGNAEKIGVNALVFTTTDDLVNVKVEVKKLVAKPSDVSETPAGELYRYIKIDAPLLAGKLKEARVQFEVPVSWLNSKDYEPENIRLARFSDNAWRELTTSILSKESDKVFYEATTPGFSYFAVTAVKKEAAAAEEGAEKAEEAAVEEEKTPAAAPAVEEKESRLIRTLLIVVGVLALLLLAAIGYKKKTPWFSGASRLIRKGRNS